jgi:hypothetical protein
LKAVEGVSEMDGDINNVGREFFERMPTVILQKFEETFQEHTKKWWSVGTLPIIIPGHPKLAKAFLCWLFGPGTSNRSNREEVRGRGQGRVRGRGNGRGRANNNRLPPADETIEHHLVNGTPVDYPIHSLTIC